jgi:hypothetical protein
MSCDLIWWTLCYGLALARLRSSCGGSSEFLLQKGGLIMSLLKNVQGGFVLQPPSGPDGQPVAGALQGACELRPFGNVLIEGVYDPAKGLLILGLKTDAQSVSASTPLEHWTLKLTGFAGGDPLGSWSYEISPVPPGHYGTGHLQVTYDGSGGAEIIFPPVPDGVQT